MAHAPPAPRPPWSLRLLEGSPLSPLAAGAALALALAAGFLLAELALGRFALYEVASWREDLRVALVLCLFAGYLPAAWLLSVRSARRTAQELAPSLSAEAAEAALGERFDRAGRGGAGVAGVVLMAVALVLIEPDPAGFDQMSPEAAFHRLLAVWIGWFGGRFGYAAWTGSRRLSLVARDGLEIDLLDLAPLTPLTRHGLRQALLAVGAFSVGALLFYDFEAAPHLVWFLAVVSAATLVLAAAGLLLPLRGVRDAIARAKARELARVNERIREARAGAGDGGPGLADWIAYRGLVESVREWPLDAPTLRRFALYLAIPLGSWLGGALVERLVDALLD